MTDPRLTAGARTDEDAQFEAGLRPRTLDEYIGQDRVRENLVVSITAARQRREALDHVLLYGPPGLGKTTLAYVIGNELGVPVRATSGPVLEKPGDLAAMLTTLKEREVLFIDEIHRMPATIEEILYPAMEDYQLDIVIGQGPGARSVKVPVQKFTLIGSTTRAGLLTSPLRGRFGIVHRLDFYREADLEERDVLFIDEIHRLNPAVEEILYPAMEDYQLDLIIGEGPAARSVKIDLAKFTLVGATTRAGLLTTPLRDRFGIPIRLNFYTVAELELIVSRGARVLGLPMSPDGANEIAKRSRGTPRIAGRLLRRVRDFAVVDKAETVNRVVADRALGFLDVDPIGLDLMDRRYLEMIAVNFGGGPVGIETIAAALSEPRDAIEDIIEPYLLQQGFLQRTPRGRLLTAQAFRHLGLAEPSRGPAQFGLFGGEEE